MQGKREPGGQWTLDPAARLSPHRRLESYFSAEFSSWRRWYLVQGVGLILLGLAALWAATAAAPAGSIKVLLFLAGTVTLAAALRADQVPGFALSLAQALIPLAASTYLLEAPRAPAPNLGLVLAAYFTASGIAAILLSVAYRRRRFRQWEWLMVSGVASLIIAALILSGLPGPYTWMFCVLLGAEFMFGGSAFLALALGAEDDAQASLR